MTDDIGDGGADGLWKAHVIERGGIGTVFDDKGVNEGIEVLGGPAHLNEGMSISQGLGGEGTCAAQLCLLLRVEDTGGFDGPGPGIPGFSV